MRSPISSANRLNHAKLSYVGSMQSIVAVRFTQPSLNWERHTLTLELVYEGSLWETTL